LTTTGMLDI